MLLGSETNLWVNGINLFSFLWICTTFMITLVSSALIRLFILCADLTNAWINAGLCSTQSAHRFIHKAFYHVLTCSEKGIRHYADFLSTFLWTLSKQTWTSVVLSCTRSSALEFNFQQRWCDEANPKESVRQHQWVEHAFISHFWSVLGVFFAAGSSSFCCWIRANANWQPQLSLSFNHGEWSNMNGKLGSVAQTKHECADIKNMFIDGKAAWWEGEINTGRDQCVQWNWWP